MRLFTLPILAAPLLLGACKLTIVQTDCLEVIASQVQRDGVRVSASTVIFRTRQECKPMAGVAYRAYRERNSVPGFQADGKPPDLLVQQVHANTGGQPTHEVRIAQVDNHGNSSEFADSWEVTVEYPDGDRSVFSGNF